MKQLKPIDLDCIEIVPKRIGKKIKELDSGR